MYSILQFEALQQINEIVTVKRNFHTTISNVALKMSHVQKHHRN